MLALFGDKSRNVGYGKKILLSESTEDISS